MQQEYFSNFKCYDGKGNRYSIIGREKDGKLEVFILKCSVKDHFARWKAKIAYMLYLDGKMVGNKIETTYLPAKGDVEELVFHPEIIIVPIEEGNSAKYTFIQFCSDNFYKKVTHLSRFEQDYLVSKNDKISIGQPRRFNKLSR